MNKREREQSPVTSQKRTNSDHAMRRSIDSLRLSSEESCTSGTEMAQIESPSLSCSESSTPSNSDTPSTRTSVTAAPNYRAALRRGSSEDQYAFRAMPSNSRQDLTRPAPISHTSVITNGLPSPQSFRERSPGDGIISSGGVHDAQLPTFSSYSYTTLSDKFPVFSTGDVYIQCSIVRPPRQWQFHSAVLARHSSWFARSVREHQAASESADWLSFTLEKIDNRFVLVRQNSEGDRPVSRTLQNNNVPGDIVVKAEVGEIADPDKTLLEKSSSNRNPQQVTTKVAQDDIAAIVVYEQVFGAFYNIAPHIVTTNIKTATAQAEELLEVAKDLGCIHLVSPHVGNALLQHRQSLYKTILDDPPRYLLLALALENEFIYAESLIHLIGAYPCWPWPTKRSALPDATRQLIAKKSRELDLQVLEAERELLLLTITTKRGTPYSAEYHSQFDTWFVVQLFRDTLTNVFRQHDASKPSLKRGRFFRKIRMGGSTYMAYEDVRKMVQAVMPSAVETLGEDLRILKDFASGIVEDLARNELSLDVEEHKVGWLTCAKVETEDIPWRACVSDYER